PAARVTGDAGRHGVDVAAPAAALRLDDGALLRAELGHAAAQLGVAVRVDGVPGVGRRLGDSRRPAEARDGRVHLAHVGRVEVHWAPAVNVWTPGWTGAVAAGAQADADGAITSIPNTTAHAAASLHCFIDPPAGRIPFCAASPLPATHGLPAGKDVTNASSPG